MLNIFVFTISRPEEFFKLYPVEKTMQVSDDSRGTQFGRWRQIDGVPVPVSEFKVTVFPIRVDRMVKE